MADHLEPQPALNWTRVGAFTCAGVAMLALAYVASSFWQGVLVNGGTTLLLFALLVHEEPRIVRLVDVAARKPRDLDEALARFPPLLAGAAVGDPDQAAVRQHVLGTIARSSLLQLPPESCAAAFTDVAGSSAVRWTVEWDGTAGIRHRVTVRGRTIAANLADSVAWSQGIRAHDERIYDILCVLLAELGRRPGTWAGWWRRTKSAGGIRGQ